MTERMYHETFSSFTSSSKRWMYDVFLSFRGEDTRKTFTGHLHKALHGAGIKVFIDDDELSRGEDITAELVRAIQASRFSVIIFSRNYADSSWCLEELVKIMECRRTLNQKVVPIFFGVDPSHVRKQTGSFGEAFKKLEDRFLQSSMDKVGRWRSALTEAANLCGWDLTNTADGHEAKFITKIVDEISGQLSITYLSEAVYPVGLDSRVYDMCLHLDVESEKVRMVGIWGIGGVGKTTVAKTIYNKFFDSFEGKSFLQNVRETTKHPNGLICLQEQLLSDILKPSKIEVHSADRGINVIKERLRCKRILVIIDDVDRVDQLNALARNRDWFGSGSRIIITTRDEHLLKQLEVDEIYSVPEMNEVEALELFSWHAFRISYPNEGYSELSESAVAYCGGLPLALEIVGSFLFGRSKTEWKSALEKLKRIPPEKIMEKLRISFDGLNDDKEKDIFLDISCFFIGRDKNYIQQILDGCDFSAEIGMSVLLQRRLLTVDFENKLMMHDLIRDMGREIVREKSPREPEKQSRLWHNKDAADVLKKDLGSIKIEGLELNVPRSDKVSLNAKAFTKMQRLRLLQLNHVQLTGSYKYLSKELRWLCWHGFPPKFIPKDFNQQSLVAIDLKYSNLTQVWKHPPQLLEKLKFLDLSHSHDLTQSPDFSKLPNLEQLILKDCRSLSEIHQSIGHLHRLSLVDLEDCKLLKDLPGSLYKSKSIEVLVLSGCSRFQNLAEDMGEMVSLRTLLLDNTAVRNVPRTIVKLKSLIYLSMCGLKVSRSNSPASLRWSSVLPRRIPKSPDLSLPSLRGLSSLQDLYLADCNLNDDAISNVGFSDLPRIRILNLSGNNFHTLPTLSGQSMLLCLRVNYCKNLYAMPDLPKGMWNLEAKWCTALETVGNINSAITQLEGCNNVAGHLKEFVLQGWTVHDVGQEILIGTFLPGKDIPEWFPFIAEGSKMSFELPEVNGSFNALTVCVTFSCCTPRQDKSYQNRIEITDCAMQIFREQIVLEYKGTSTSEDHFGVALYTLGHSRLHKGKFNFEGGRVCIFVDFEPRFTIEKVGVSLVRDQFINGENVRSLLIRDNGLRIVSSEGNDQLFGRDQVNNHLCFEAGPSHEEEEVNEGEEEDDLKYLVVDLGQKDEWEQQGKLKPIGNEENEGLSLQKMPPSLRLLCKYAETEMKTYGYTIQLTLEEEVFGFPRQTYILHEDILQLGGMLEVGATAIAMYMRCLYDVLKRSKLTNVVKLVDPAKISVGCGSCDKRSRYLATRFEVGNPKQITLVPYNTGNHWLLAIINANEETVYHMDSLYGYLNNDEMQSVVDTAIRVFNSENNRSGRKAPIWKIMQGTPKQPNGIQCGYYVMRHMKELVEDSSLDFVDKWEKKMNIRYTQVDLDEVRKEWADFVRNYICQDYNMLKTPFFE